jgi:multidrug efflux pump subunit AcrB
MNLKDVLNIPATAANQSRPITLGELAKPRRTDAAVEINHVALARVFNVEVGTENIDVGHLGQAVHEQLVKIDVPAGMHVSLKGEYRRMNDSFRSLGFGLALAAVLVYLLLVALFRSWMGPFIIMCTLPLGLIGVLVILYVTGTTLNVQSEMGVIFLVGIAVSNGVLLVDFANGARKQGASVHDAIARAAAIRFRPILMTFLATFFDLVPMAIGLGRGSEANAPLARAVVGGLLTSTALTLFVVPILYTLLMSETKGRSSAEDLDVILARRARAREQALAEGKA